MNTEQLQARIYRITQTLAFLKSERETEQMRYVIKGLLMEQAYLEKRLARLQEAQP